MFIKGFIDVEKCLKHNMILKTIPGEDSSSPRRSEAVHRVPSGAGYSDFCMGVLT